MSSYPPINENSIRRKPITKASYPAKAINETLTNGFFSVDQKWIVKYWNRSAEILLKVKASDIIGKNLWEELAGILPLEFYTVYQKAFVKDVPVHFQEYWGEMGAWFNVITYYCDDTLSVSFTSSNYDSLNHPENLLQRLKAITELYRFVTEITNDCLWEWDLQSGEIFWIDGGHKRIFGYPVENALIPQSFWESRIHPDDRVRVLAHLHEILKQPSGDLWEEEYRFKKADGTYAYVHDRGHIIYNEDKAYRMIGATQDITEKVILEKELKQQKLVNQKEITAAVLISQERERMEIGRELHENLNQVLAVAKIYQGLSNKTNIKQAAFMKKSNDLITDVMHQIGKISKRLAPTGMGVLSLSESLGILFHDFGPGKDIIIDFHEDGINLSDLDKDLQLHIFRIIQEQLDNIVQHACASHIGIKISKAGDELILFISDNGNGCDGNNLEKGVGIRNITSRVELFNGMVVIVSRPTEGFSMNIVIPLNVNNTTC